MFLSNPSLVELPSDALQRATLPDRIYTILKRRLLTGKIKPGQRLFEKDLSTSLGVSRTPLREALNRLANEGLVTSLPNTGISATPLTSAGFRKLNELRLVVESQVAMRAASRATPEDIAAMREAADMPPVDISRSETFEAYCQANARFHLLVVRSTGNSLFEGIVMAALDHFQIPAYLGFGPQTDSNNPSQRHNELVDAIEARDEAKAHAIMSQHVISGGDRILAALIEAGY
ncbi:MAG: GntR family transcriptional regulator [Opitutaceae bacterium]